jgi:hypothetical protein
LGALFILKLKIVRMIYKTENKESLRKIKFTRVAFTNSNLINLIFRPFYSLRLFLYIMTLDEDGFREFMEKTAK